MKFNPDALGLIPDGDKCFAEVKDAIDYVSKNSNKESIKITLDIWEDVSVRCTLDVYLTPKYPKLFKHAIVSMLGDAKFKSGDVSPADFIGRVCDVEIGIQKELYQGREIEKNIITDFFPSTQQKPITSNDQSLPF